MKSLLQETKEMSANFFLRKSPIVMAKMVADMVADMEVHMVTDMVADMAADKKIG